MTAKFIDQSCINRRDRWIDEIVRLSGQFGADSSRVEDELATEVSRDGISALTDHLRMCGAIPERYRHDSSEEKLYSKYTDSLLATTFRFMGLTASVLLARADSADVESVAEGYSFVADAKAFRLSRTAKNQKDFKVEAMAKWRAEKPHAIVVCPIYQFPSNSSQIYRQAGATGVTILSFSHLAVMARAKFINLNAVDLLHAVLRTSEALNPTKDASTYWTSLNRAMLDFSPHIKKLWEEEKLANLEAIAAAKTEALKFLSQERASLLRLSREEAIKQLISDRNLPRREATIQSVADNMLLSLK